MFLALYFSSQPSCCGCVSFLGDIRDLSDFKCVFLCRSILCVVEGHAIFGELFFKLLVFLKADNSVGQEGVLFLQSHVIVLSYCICMFNFCSSGSGWKKNTGKTLLRICKKPKIFWLNIKSRQSCSRVLEEDSGITTSHLCSLSHTVTTQQRPNCRGVDFLFFLPLKNILP